MGTNGYDPKSYRNELITGDGRLSTVGQPALGVYNSYAYRSRLRSLNKALEGVDLGRMMVFEAAFGLGFYLAYWHSQGVPVVPKWKFLRPRPKRLNNPPGHSRVWSQRARARLLSHSTPKQRRLALAQRHKLLGARLAFQELGEVRQHH